MSNRLEPTSSTTDSATSPTISVDAEAAAALARRAAGAVLEHLDQRALRRLQRRRQADEQRTNQRHAGGERQRAPDRASARCSAAAAMRRSTGSPRAPTAPSSAPTAPAVIENTRLSIRNCRTIAARRRAERLPHGDLLLPRASAGRGTATRTLAQAISSTKLTAPISV